MGGKKLLSMEVAIQLGINIHGSEEEMRRTAEANFNRKASECQNGKRATFPKFPDLEVAKCHTFERHRGQVSTSMPYLKPGTRTAQRGLWCRRCSKNLESVKTTRLRFYARRKISKGDQYGKDSKALLSLIEKCEAAYSEDDLVIHMNDCERLWKEVWQLIDSDRNMATYRRKSGDHYF